MKKAPYRILYEDDSLLVVYKERDVFSVMTEDVKTKHHNLYFYLQCYARRKQENVFLVHRLDYETSGVMIFAKDKETCHLLRETFENREVERRYEAVVKESLPSDFHQTVTQYLREDKNTYQVYEDRKTGKEAVTEIAYANPIQIGTALDIRIETGRKNQIRMALHNLGLTLIGDRRYSKDDAKRMYLNAYSLTFPEKLKLKERVFSVSPLWIIAPSCKEEKKPIE